MAGLDLRKIVSGILVVLLPLALSAQTAGTAVVYGTGSVYLNGAQLTRSSATTAGDVIQTRENGFANINAAGSTAVVESNSIVRMQPDGFSLDRGSISVATGKGSSVFARDFKITPVNSNWTEFYVTRTNGSIGIIARKNDVTVGCGSGSTTVKQGEQISREDAANCGLLAKGRGAPAAATGPIITPAYVKAGGIIIGGTLATWALAQSDDPVSPSVP
ncbi:MAG TPA: hypothetical protein VF133_01380 [Terriglobales bacterium]